MEERIVYLCSLAQAEKMEKMGTLKAFVENAEAENRNESLIELKDRAKGLVDTKDGLLTIQERSHNILQAMKGLYHNTTALQIGGNLKWTKVGEKRTVERRVGNRWIAMGEVNGDEFFTGKVITQKIKL